MDFETRKAIYGRGGAGWDLIEGDSSVVLKEVPDGIAHAVVTDPPAGIALMGWEWDTASGDGQRGKGVRKPSDRQVFVERLTPIFKEALRILKPGGHALVWALPRTSHWTAWALEEAGFEVRDVVCHFFGTGMPKGTDIAKRIDKMRGTLGLRPVVGKRKSHDTTIVRPGFTGRTYSGSDAASRTYIDYEYTTAAHADALPWDGWNSTLKPAMEHWIVARRPLKTSLVKNVLEHGAGGINVDACRTEDEVRRWPTNAVITHAVMCTQGRCSPCCPAVALEEQQEGALQYFPRFLYVHKPTLKARSEGLGRDNPHPTAKAMDLMHWLCRLVTPTNGLIIDPFSGSGTTGAAAVAQGFRFLGIERDPLFAEVAADRIRYAAGLRTTTTHKGALA